MNTFLVLCAYTFLFLEVTNVEYNDFLKNAISCVVDRICTFVFLKLVTGMLLAFIITTYSCAHTLKIMKHVHEMRIKQHDPPIPPTPSCTFVTPFRHGLWLYNWRLRKIPLWIYTKTKHGIWCELLEYYPTVWGFTHSKAIF